jgi:hypothetical protein
MKQERRSFGGCKKIFFTGHQAKTALTLWANPPMNHRVNLRLIDFGLFFIPNPEYRKSETSDI